MQKIAAKNRAEIRLCKFPGWGINKHFWPEYSPGLILWKLSSRCWDGPTDDIDHEIYEWENGEIQVGVGVK